MNNELQKEGEAWGNIGEHMKEKHPHAKYFGTSPAKGEDGEWWEICQLCGEKLTKL